VFPAEKKIEAMLGGEGWFARSVVSFQPCCFLSVLLSASSFVRQLRSQIPFHLIASVISHFLRHVCRFSQKKKDPN
jgi:hypothetical protein